MKAENRLSATTTLTVNVVDSDDLDPTFEHDVYTSKVRTSRQSSSSQLANICLALAVMSLPCWCYLPTWCPYSKLTVHTKIA